MREDEHGLNQVFVRMWWFIGVGVVAALILQKIFSAVLRKSGIGFRGSRSWKFWLIFLGLSAAVTMVATSMISVAMISIIGIPIGIYLMAAPFLFLVVLGTWLIRHVTGQDWMGTLAALVATLILLAIPPYFANQKLDQIAKAEVAADHDEGSTPKANVIAVVYDTKRYSTRDAVNCDGFCQRALLNGVAKRVLVLQQDLTLAIVPSVQTDSFRMEKRASCPAVKLPQGQDPIEIADEKKDFKAKRVDELMQLEIAKGNCLIAEKARLGSADLILSVGNVRQGANALSAGLSLFADTVQADRIAMHEKRGDAFAETYRKTFVVTYKLAPLYAPTAEGGSELRMYPALARMRETINVDAKYYEKPDWTAFLTQRLGMDIALRRDNADADVRTVLKDATLRTGEGQSMPGPVAEAFFHGVMQKNKITGEDLDLARTILVDERYPVFRDSWSAIRYPQGAAPDYFDAIAASMFKRLRVHSAAQTVKAGSGWHEELSAIDNVLSAMPRETILKHRNDLDWLSRQDAVRVQTRGVLARFADFGAEGVGPLLFLIDDAQRFREGKGNDWQHPYLAGMTGLCKLGADGRAAIQPLFDRLDSGVIANWASYNRLAVHTLVRMGADREEIWQHSKPQKQLSAEDFAKKRKDFDQQVERAQKLEECWY